MKKQKEITAYHFILPLVIVLVGNLYTFCYIAALKLFYKNFKFLNHEAKN